MSDNLLYVSTSDDVMEMPDDWQKAAIAHGMRKAAETISGSGLAPDA